MSDYDLPSKQKLLQHVEAFRQRGIAVRVERRGPNHCAGCADENGITLNNYHIRGLDPDYDEDRLIVVLYHEEGHVKYKRRLPPSQRAEEEDEFAAFSNSVEAAVNLARHGERGPLRRAVHCIPQRANSPAESAEYRAALARLLQTDLWKTAVAENGRA